MAGSRLVIPSQQPIQSVGLPYVGGQLFFYLSGTSTPTPTYSDSGLTIPNTNPVVLDSSGNCGNVFLNPGIVYKVVLEDANNNLIWSYDPVYPFAPGTLLGFNVCGVSTGTGNAQIVSGPGTVQSGQAILFTAGFTNTGPMTLNTSSGALQVYQPTTTGPSQLTGGEVVAGNTYLVTYVPSLNSNAGGWQLSGPFSLKALTPGAVLLTTNTTIAASQIGTLLEMTGSSNFTTTLPAPSACSGQTFPIWNSSSVAQTLSTPSGNFTGFAGTPAATFSLPAAAAVVASSDGTNWILLGTNLSPVVASSVRQTVQQGPGGGSPSFLPATAVALSLTSQNITSGAPLVVSSANGFGTSGQVDSIGVSNANLTWSGLTASNTNYLGVTVVVGSLTAFSTTLQPIYQYGGALSTTSGQYSFDIAQMKMFLGNGSAAVQTNAVFVGEAVTSGSAVTSTVAYAYNGYYDSGFTATLPGLSTSISKNSNIGISDQIVTWVTECTTTDNGYAVGDRLNNQISANQSSNSGATISQGRNTINVSTGSTTGPFPSFPKGGGVEAPLTAANWKYKLVAKRAW